MRSNPETGRVHWCYLIAVLGLALTLLLPSLASAQVPKDPSEDDPATEEPFDDRDDDPRDDPDDEPADASDLEAAGLVDDDAYESPQFAYTVEWSRDWAVDFEIEAIRGHPPVISDEGNEQDQLYLIWSDGPGEESYAIYSGQTANRGGPDGDVEEWTDEDWIDGQWEADFEVEVLLEDTTRTAAAVLYSVVDVEGDGLQYYTIYQSIEFEDGATLYLTFSAFEDWFEVSYLSWSEDVEINGEPLEIVLDWDDIEAAI